MKRDQWEGGHRTPFIVRWPGTVQAGSTSGEITSLTDVFATCATIAGARLPNDAAEDSYDILPVLKGEQGEKPIRPYTLQQTMSLAMSVRRGDWKYLDHKGSGGNGADFSAISTTTIARMATCQPAVALRAMAVMKV